MTTSSEFETDLLSALVMVGFVGFRVLSRMTSRTPPYSIHELSNLSRPPFITIYRASLMVMTCMAVLCVDFVVFPQRNSKTETFGVSLMDIGVGQFVFSAAVAVGGKMGTSKDNDFNVVRFRYSRRFLGSTVPLFTFAGIRFFVIWITGYRVHVSEYGLHWNFFVTLACLPVVNAILESIKHFVFPKFTSPVFGVSALAVVVVHQWLLSYIFTDYVLSPRRRDFVEANKEGIVSLTGYLAIWLAGCDCGWLLFRNRRNRDRGQHTSVALTCLAIAAVLYQAAMWFDTNIQETSRKMCNAAYVTFVISLSLVALGALYLLDVASASRTSESTTVRDDITRRSTILESINENQFVLFLLSNLATGAVNLSIWTVIQPRWVAYCLLTVYAVALSGVALLLHDVLKLKLKMW